jgi:hypothetical protein
MKIGTKSVLFGAHQFILHPLFVAAAWWKLYGFPWDPRLWLAFVLHDIGYLGKPNMDGPEGERHVEFGAHLMSWLFGPAWGDFCVYHSRFYAKRDGQPFSRLCVADKLSIVFTPAWIYLPAVRATGEIHEYMSLARDVSEKYSTMQVATDSQALWYADVQGYLKRWVQEHKDGREDTWTPESA